MCVCVCEHAMTADNTDNSGGSNSRQTDGQTLSDSTEQKQPSKRQLYKRRTPLILPPLSLTATACSRPNVSLFNACFHCSDFVGARRLEKTLRLTTVLEWTDPSLTSTSTRGQRPAGQLQDMSTRHACSAADNRHQVVDQVMTHDP